MQAMIFYKVGQPLQLETIPKPTLQPTEVLIKVSACAVCRTDLHIIDSDLPAPHLPLILGHQILGTIEKTGNPNSPFKLNERVGIPWLGSTCGKCYYCLNTKENLCDNAVFTGYTKNGGFAEYTVANENYVFPLPHKLSDPEAAPLLCPGLIGYRSYRMTENAKKLGFYGFGASAHILIQVALHEGKDV